MDNEKIILKVGQIVEWESQASGTWKRKRGEIIYSGEPIRTTSWYGRNLPTELRDAPRSRVHFNTISGIVVRVDDSTPGYPHYYSPTTRKRLRIVSEPPAS